MADYSATLPPIYKAHGGIYLGIGGPGRGVECLGGDWAGRSLVLAKFTDHASVSAFWHSPEYTRAKKLREGAGNFEVFSVPGRALPPAGTAAYLISVVSVANREEFERSLDAKESMAQAAGLTTLARARSIEIPRLEGDGSFDVIVRAAPSADAAKKFYADTRGLPTAPGSTFLVTARP
jgi:uncharacterized protein (DUF1330 family)